MAIKPILFNTEMVNAILEGRKTQTRRVLNNTHPVVTGFVPNGERGYWKGTAKSEQVIQQYITTFPFTIKCPFGMVGDRLWVRETFAPVNLYGEIALAYKADSDVIRVVENESFQDDDGTINYDDPRLEKYSFAAWADDVLSGTEGNWKPSIHMPRWASRILLEITNIRVERLQDISNEDAKAEGFDFSTDPSAVEMGYAIGARTNFRHTWEQIYGANAWNKNQWVWVVEFVKLNEVTA